VDREALREAVGVTVLQVWIPSAIGMLVALGGTWSETDERGRRVQVWVDRRYPPEVPVWRVRIAGTRLAERERTPVEACRVAADACTPLEALMEPLALTW
jgi:hypothetical protein